MPPKKGISPEEK